MSMNTVLSEKRSLYFLSKYNRKIGLPSIFVASVLTSLILGSSIYFDVKVAETLLGLIVAGLLFFLSADTLLLLVNLVVMDYFFDRVLKGFYERGLPYASLSGIEALKDSSTRETRYASVIFVSSTAALVMYLLGNISYEIIFIYISMGLALMTFGFSIIKREHVFDSDEILRLYEPDTFPAMMKTDNFLETFIDPFNRLKFDEYKRELSAYLKTGLTAGDALSKISLLLYHNLHGAVGGQDLRAEISDLLESEEYVAKLEFHQSYNFNRLKIILAKAKRLVPEFIRLLDRLFINALDNLPDVKNSLIFVDAEVSWEKRRGQLCKAFVLLYNNQPEKAGVLTVNYSAPAFAPSSAELVVALPPRDFDLPAEDVLPVYSRTDQDVVGFASRIMDNVRVVWFSFEVKENGVKPVFITVRDRETGQTIFGQTFLVEASYDLSGLVLKAFSLSSVFLGMFLPILRILKLPI